MGGISIIYVIILGIDLLVGSAIVLWKCQFQSAVEECELAIGGAVGSVIMWLLLLFICPYCVVGGYKTANRISRSYHHGQLISAKSDQYQVNLQTALALSRQSHVKDVDTPYIASKTSHIVMETHIQPTKTDPASFQSVCETDTIPLINQDTDNI